MQPLYLKPIPMERVWGGTRLAARFGDSLKSNAPIGESWELVDRPEAQSIIHGGTFDGMILRDVLAAHSAPIWGQLAHNHPLRFPLLIKYIDADTALSVQVHPDDAGALSLGDRGKSECWVVLHTEPGAKIIRGLRKGITRATYEKALAEDRIEDVLHSFSPKTGDVVALPAGMVHAIGAGLMVAEVQQNSDITFRIYDYKRVGLDGQPRKLHIQEALGAIRFEGPWPEFSGDMQADTVAPLSRHVTKGVITELLLQGHYFDLQRMTLPTGAHAALPAMPEAPRVLMALSGAGTLAGRPIKSGETVLLPAAMPAISALSTAAEPLVLLLSTPTAAAC